MSSFLKSSSMVIKCLLLSTLLLNNVQASGLPRTLLTNPCIFNVNQFGAVADGKTDTSQAFNAAWCEACKAGGVILFPKGTYLLNPLILKGIGCKGPIEVQIQGTLLASREKRNSIGIDHWILFRYVSDLTITGGGTLDGQGDSTWPLNDCRTKKCTLPGSLKFDFANNTKVINITSLNAKFMHINCFACNNVVFSNIKIIAPDESPNTDGIKIGQSTNVEIYDNVIGTGDDCLAFLPDSSNISVARVHCGPGHGISLGSMSSKCITNLRVTNCSLKGTDNGVRIKTKSPSQPGTVSNITFQNIHMDNVKNPIVVDQEYCPGGGCVAVKPSEIQVTDVKYINVWGTSKSEFAVAFKCSKSNPCKNIELRDINLTSSTGGPSKPLCCNVKGVASGVIKPASCMQKGASPF